jgi:hypothetical protein
MEGASLSDYILGIVQLGAVFGALYVGALRVRLRLLPGWAGAPARLAEAIVAIGALVLTLEIVGVVGLYRPGFVLAGAIVAGALMSYFATPAADRPGPPSPDVSVFMVLAAGIGATLVAAHWAFPTQAGMDHGMYLPNTTWQQMPFAARFVQDHQVGDLLFTDPLKLAVWFYPQNSELLHSSGILFMGNDFLSPLLNIGWLAGCLLAAWCIGRPYAVGAAALIGVALVCDENMLLLYQPGDAKNDIMGLFFLLASAAILVNAEAGQNALAGSARTFYGTGKLTPTTRFGDGALFIAALSAGLCMGTKINMLAPIAALTVGVLVVAAPWAQGALRSSVFTAGRWRVTWVWALGLLAGGGFWFIRNAVNSSGNPLPWVNKGPLPGPDQLELYVREPHTVSDYLFNGTVISDFFKPGLENAFGTFWPAILLVAVASVVLIVWKAETPTLRMLGFVAAVSGVAYLFTPLTAAGDLNAPTAFQGNIRYVAPALVLALAILPTVPWLRRGNGPWLVLGGLWILLAESLISSNQWDNVGYRPGATFLAIVLVAMPFGAVVLLQRGLPRFLVAAGVLVVLAGGFKYGRERETDYLSGRYVPDTVPDQIPNGIPEAMAATNRLHNANIALGGSTAGFKQYLFYGRDISNRVQYLGDRGSNGTFRPIDNCAEFRRAIDDGGYDYIVTAPPHTDLNIPPPETTWVESDPNSQLVESFFGTSVYKLNGPLDPKGCDQLTPDQQHEDPLAASQGSL